MSAFPFLVMAEWTEVRLSQYSIAPNSRFYVDLATIIVSPPTVRMKWLIDMGDGTSNDRISRYQSATYKSKIFEDEFNCTTNEIRNWHIYYSSANLANGNGWYYGKQKEPTRWTSLSGWAEEKHTAFRIACDALRQGR